MTVEDSYAIQNVWRRRDIAAGRRLVGPQDRADLEGDAGGDRHHRARLRRDLRRHGLSTSGVGDRARPFSNVRIEVELAFVLGDAARGPGRHALRRAARHRVRRAGAGDPQLAHRAGRAARSSTRSATTPRWAAMVYGGNPTRSPTSRPALGVGAALPQRDDRGDRRRRRGARTIPRPGVAWLANKLAQHGDRLRPARSSSPARSPARCGCTRATRVLADYGPMGTISCRFV